MLIRQPQPPPPPPRLPPERAEPSHRPARKSHMTHLASIDMAASRRSTKASPHGEPVPLHDVSTSGCSQPPRPPQFSPMAWTRSFAFSRTDVRHPVPRPRRQFPLGLRHQATFAAKVPTNPGAASISTRLAARRFITRRASHQIDSPRSAWRIAQKTGVPLRWSSSHEREFIFCFPT